MTRDGALRRRVLPGTRRVLVGVAVGCVLSQLAFVTVSAASPTTLTDNVGWVTGVVVDANGDPVVGDLVNAIGPREVPEAGIIADQTDRRAFTDDKGGFRVRQADPRGYLIQICNPEPTATTACKETAQGVTHVITYAGPVGVTDSWVTQNSLFPTTSKDRHLGTVTVKPQGFVHGHVSGPAYQSVRILRLNGTVAFYNSTDAQGDYRFTGMAPGRYRIGAGGDGYRPWQSDVFTLAPNEDRLVNATLDRGADIHGFVRSAGKAVPFLDILVRRSGGQVVAAATTDERGFYRAAGLLPGSFRVGVSYDGSDYKRRSYAVTLDDPHASIAQPVTLTRGSVITVALRSGGQPAIRASDELRDSTGHPILGQRNEGGQVTYPGLSAGDYTIVAANATHFVKSTVHVTTTRTYDLGTLSLTRPTLTLSGTTAPGAVVEAATGNQCPPDGPVSPGSFQFIERADSTGHYVMHGLVPGSYMLGVDGWPGNYAPHCLRDVVINVSRTKDLNLRPGSMVTGRLVYASNGRPVITQLSYEVAYPPLLDRNPTDEHPARAKTRGSTGYFRIDRLAAGSIVGGLAQGGDTDQVTSPKLFVIFPFQDGTPYYLTSKSHPISLDWNTEAKVGDVRLHLRH